MGEGQPRAPTLTTSSSHDRAHKMDGRCNMDILTGRDNEIHPERSEIYEPPMLDEIGEFTALTRADANGKVVDGTAYYSE